MPAKRKKKRSVGRPRIKFDMKELENLCRMQCTDEELAGWFDCSVETIEGRRKKDPEFLRVYTKGREAGKISLRRAQWQAALGGNVTMLIWLGKQLLGQVDSALRTETEVKGPVYIIDADEE